MIRTDRLDAVATEVARVIEATPLPPGTLPPAIETAARFARMAGLDLDATVRATAAGSLRSLASQASADPARADALAGWLAHLLAWVRDERDDPPPADIPW